MENLESDDTISLDNEYPAKRGKTGKYYNYILCMHIYNVPCTIITHIITYYVFSWKREMILV